MTDNHTSPAALIAVDWGTSSLRAWLLDADGQVLDAGGEPIAGLYAAGEVAGFGGGGYHGYNALEGTFLGGCIFSGRCAGRHAATVV